MLLMGTRQVHQQKQVLFQAPCSLVLHDTSYNQQTKQNQDHHNNWMIMEADQSSSSSSLEDSSASSTISNSSDLVDDDASSTNSSSSSSNSNGPLFQLSGLMSQLPIKMGLSKYYEGKSQSFTSLSRAMSIDDMAKKETPYRKKMKACKSYGGGLDVKATISKKASSSSSSSSRGSFSSLLSCSSGRRRSFLGHNNNSNNSLPPVPVQKHF